MDEKQDPQLFKFKQFEINQTGCAMKINTDGVLLATMAEFKSPKRILDIGTGTGVIALMMAQRFPDALIEAVEIDESASAAAERNFNNSIFKNRLTINHCAIEQYSSTEKFDLIITNPPFFVNDFKSSEAKKGIARHTDQEFFLNLISKVDELLSRNGTFWFVLPVKQAEFVVKNAAESGLFLNKVIHLHSDRHKSEFRRVISLQRTHADVRIEHFYIYESEKVYTEAYNRLLKDFFL